MANGFLNNLEAYYSMDANTGANQPDASVNSNTAVHNGAEIDKVSGKILSAARLNFGGGAEFYEIASDASLVFGDEDFSISLWSNQIDESGGSGSLFSQWVGTTKRSYTILYSQTPNTIVFNCSPDGTNTNQGPGVQSGLAPIVFGTWYHVVAVHDSVNNLLILYVTPDTESSPNAPDSAAYSAGAWGASDAVTHIGKLDPAGPGYIHGTFDEVGVWRRAFDLMRMAVESSLYPVISRQDAIQIIGRRSVDNAVKNGKLPPVQHGKQLFFDRISFYEYCKLGSLDIYGAGYP